MTSRTLKNTLAVLALGAGALAVASTWHTRAEAWPVPQASAVATQVSLPDFAGIVEKTAPAVVQITVDGDTTRDAQGAAPADFPYDELFRHFGLPWHPPVPEAHESPQRHGIGSGFILGADGYILTNAHVVDHAREITVKLADRREFKGKVVGTDQKSDVALVKINADDLPTVALGKSDGLRVGQWVLAIGAPFGLERTATQGIVSALGRSLPDDAYPFIQTDVPLNPGNSGGPLIDTAGRVVGINAQIYSNTGGYMGLSFAIPIDSALEIAKQLRDDGHVSRGWLGVAVQSVNQDLARSFGLEKPRGALIADVSPDSPAHRAGLKSGDIILGFDGKEVNDSGDLPSLVSNQPPGKQVPIEILRNGHDTTLNLTLGTPPEAQAAHPVHLAEANGGRLGIVVRDISPEERGNLSLEAGVRVLTVGPGPAADSGLRRGDILLAVNGARVSNSEQLRDLVLALPKDRPAAFLVRRDDAHLYLAVRPGPRPAS